MQISQLNGNPLVMGGEALLDTYYPVGRIYFSTVNVSPASFIGGTWERIEDVFLLCAGNTYAAGSTGGAADVTLSVEQMPSHRHNFETAMQSWGHLRQDGDQQIWILGTANQQQLTYTGGNQSHNNMPPYRAVYAWSRVA